MELINYRSLKNYLGQWATIIVGNLPIVGPQICGERECQETPAKYVTFGISGLEAFGRISKANFV